MGKRDLGDQSIGQRRSRLTAAARFAAAISAHYLRSVATEMRVPRILRRAFAWTALYEQHWSTLIAPPIQIAIARSQRQSAPPAITQTVLARETHQRVVERYHTRTRLASAAYEALDQPHRQPAQRAFPTARLHTMAPAERVTQTEPLPRVLQRPPRPEQRPAEPLSTATRRNGTEPVVELPPAELERVTTHVVRAIDRRLSAWRERTGRI